MNERLVNNGSGAFSCVIADDSEFSRKTMAGIVSRIGGEIVGEAANGLEALSLFKSLRPDVVLLDITMPEMDGVEALSKIIEQDALAKVIIVSSIGHKEMVWKAITIGAKHYVTKPYNSDYVGMIIKSVIGRGN